MADSGPGQSDSPDAERENDTGSTPRDTSICKGLRFAKQDYISRTGFNYGDSWMMSWGSDGRTYTNFSDGQLSPNNRETNALLTINDDPPNLTAASFAAISSNPLQRENSWAYYITNTIVIGDTLYVAAVDIAPGGLGAASAGIARSPDLGKTLVYDRAKPMWPAGGKKPFVYPTFLQNGAGYRGNADGFMYVYATDGDWGRVNRIRLARVKTSSDLLDVANYEYFAGSGWSSDLGSAADILADGASLGGMQSVLYNPTLKRYFLTTFGEPESPSARMTVYDAADPWGPWFNCGVIPKAEAIFTQDQLFHSVYNPSFNAKWITPGGDMWISYSNYTPIYTFHYGLISIDTKH